MPDDESPLWLALRQTPGFVESLLRLVGFDWPVPNFSTLNRRQRTLAVTIPYRGPQGRLHLLIDSTGINAEGEGAWHAASMVARNAAYRRMKMCHMIADSTDELLQMATGSASRGNGFNMQERRTSTSISR